VVVAFVMPCAACIGPSQASYASVQSYATSYPGRVLFYISDDNADTSCDTVSAWAIANGLTGVPCFSNSSFISTQYGGIAMPKIVVLAGSNDSVYFIQNNAVDVHNLQSSIAAALAATAINENVHNDFELSVFPNPSYRKTMVEYSLAIASDVTIDIFNSIGIMVKKINEGKQSEGSHIIDINFESFEAGNYFIKLVTKDAYLTRQFSIAN
jgi:hypothetical protein